MPCSDERQKCFKGLKLKPCKFLQPFFTSCEQDCFCPRTVKHFGFKCLRRFLKINFFRFFKTVLRTLKTSFKKITTCSIDLLFFLIKIEDHINISHEKCKYYIVSCIEATDG